MNRDTVEAINKYPCDRNGGIDRDHGICDITEYGVLKNSQQEKADGYFRKGNKRFIRQDEGKKPLAETGSARFLLDGK